jgi:hypothetical protein
MTSNDLMPIRLDSRDSGNRRFTIIKTWNVINLEKWSQIAKTIKNKQNIENFLAFLFKKFPDIIEKQYILPLDNEDKRNLEFISENVWNLFFEWFEEKFPNIKYLRVSEREVLLNNYRNEVWEKEYNDYRYTVWNFEKWLSTRYKKIPPKRLNWKTVRCYEIDKQVEWEWYFTEEEWKKYLISRWIFVDNNN